MATINFELIGNRQIKLQSGDRLNIPDDCIVTVENGVVLVKKKEPEFKKGDFLTTSLGIILIFEKYVPDGYFDSLFNTDIKEDNKGWAVNKARFATEEEKQILIEKLHDAGKDWDAEKCEVVDYVWEPKIHDTVFIPKTFNGIYKVTEFKVLHKYHTEFLFKTEELCQDFCNKANELLKNVKKF